MPRYKVPPRPGSHPTWGITFVHAIWSNITTIHWPNGAYSETKRPHLILVWTTLSQKKSVNKRTLKIWWHICPATSKGDGKYTETNSASGEALLSDSLTACHSSPFSSWRKPYDHVIGVWDKLLNEHLLVITLTKRTWGREQSKQQKNTNCLELTSFVNTGTSIQKRPMRKNLLAIDKIS